MPGPTLSDMDSSRQEHQKRVDLTTTQMPYRYKDVLRAHGVIAVTLFLGFVTRLFLADENSYWLDELRSVVTHGINNQTVVDMIKGLAKQSIHPPLYQFILFYWIDLFGHSELATRTLSNLYVAFATLCLYILTFRLYGLRVAIATALIFSLMNVPIYYALETRSYAQTLFLSSLSSLLFFQFLRGSERLSGAFRFNDARLWLLLLANFALLMTHYYNVFFLGAQGIFLFAYLLLRNRGAPAIAAAAKAVTVVTIPVLFFLLTWGGVMAASFEKRRDIPKYVADVPAKGAFSIFFDLVATPNFLYPSLVLSAMGALLLPRVIGSAKDIYRGDARTPAYFDFYFLGATIIPCLLAYLLFLASGYERYSTRYFVFCTPPLVVLLVLSLFEGARWFNRLAAPIHPFYNNGLALSVITIVAVIIVLPGGYTAATRETENWRGTAKAIVDVAASEPKKTFIVYAHYRLNYYLSRFSKTLRVGGTLGSRSKDEPRKFEGQLKNIGKNDYLVLVFTHDKPRHFPKTLAYLAARFDVHISALNDGLGFVVYKLR